MSSEVSRCGGIPVNNERFLDPFGCRSGQAFARNDIKTVLMILVALGAIAGALAQESPTPAQAPTSSPAPTASPARNVRIRFVPPPLEGTISLGIYDVNAKLVRVLEQEAELDQFEIGDDGLTTR